MTTRGTITVDPILAAADGLNTETLKRYWRDRWGIQIEVKAVGRHPGMKMCKVCERLLEYRHYTRRFHSDGRPSNYDGVCISCRAERPIDRSGRGILRYHEEKARRTGQSSQRLSPRPRKKR